MHVRVLTCVRVRTCGAGRRRERPSVCRCSHLFACAVRALGCWQDLEAKRQCQQGRETPAHALHARVVLFHVLPPPREAGFVRPHVWPVQREVCARVPALDVAADVVALFRVAARLAGGVERLLPQRRPPAVVGIRRCAYLHLAGGVERKEALHVRIQRCKVAVGHPWGAGEAKQRMEQRCGCWLQRALPP